MIKIKELTIINNNGQLLVDSREVAEKVGKRHDNLLRDIENYLNAIKINSKLRVSNFFVESTYEDSMKRNKPCFLITKIGCDMVANKMTGTKGILFTAEYVTKFEDMANQLKAPVVSLPKTYAEALRELAASEEEKERLIQEKTVLEQKIVADAPAIDYHDRLVKNEHLTNFRDTANEIGVMPSKFTEWLIDKGYVYRRTSDNKIRARAKYNHDLFEEKDFVSTTNNYSSVTTRVTVRGKEVFIKRLKKEGLI